MTIVRTDYRRKRPPKRKTSVVIPGSRIVSAKKPKPGPTAPAIKEAVTEQKRPAAQPAAITGPRIVTARKPRPKHGIGPEQIAAAREAAPADPPPAIRKSAIVTASGTRAARRLPDVPEMTVEEHRRRGDAVEALFEEIARRARE